MIICSKQIHSGDRDIHKKKGMILQRKKKERTGKNKQTNKQKQQPQNKNKNKKEQMLKRYDLYSPYLQDFFTVTSLT